MSEDCVLLHDIAKDAVVSFERRKDAGAEVWATSCGKSNGALADGKSIHPSQERGTFTRARLTTNTRDQ